MPNILRLFRQAAGLTQRDLVAKLNKKGIRVSQSTYSLWETGYRRPELEEVEVLSKILKVREELLLS